MRPGQSLAAFLVAFLAFFSLAEAREKPKLDKKTREKARALFEEADAHYKIKEYEKALQGFKEAYLLSEEPVLLFNIAQCQRQLGLLSEALQSYRTFLLEDPNTPLRANAEERIAELEAELARLAALGAIEVKSQPDSATIYLDGERKGETPLTISDIAPGEHLLALEKEGFLRYEMQVTIKPSQTFAVQIPLEEIPAPVQGKMPGISRVLYIGAGGALGLGALAGGFGLSFSLSARKQQQEGVQPGEEEKIGELMATARLLSIAADGLALLAVVSGGTAFVLQRKAKRTEVTLSASPLGAGVTIRY